MQFEVSPQELAKAKAPHELFLTNLVGNHILWFVASLGIANSFWQPIAMVPVFSLLMMGYTVLRAKRELKGESWFVMCHWQLAARRSKALMLVMSLLLMISLLGWVGYSYLGMMEVAVYALIGGVGLLPMLVSVLVLIVMEMDAMHLASQGKLTKGIVDRFPNAQAVLISDAEAAVNEAG